MENKEKLRSKFKRRAKKTVPDNIEKNTEEDVLEEIETPLVTEDSEASEVKAEFLIPESKEFVGTKNYNTSFSFDIHKDKDNPKKANWISLLNFYNLKSLKMINEKENSNEKFAELLIKEGLFKSPLYLKELKYLIGFLVNRGPVIVDDILIYGINSAESTFLTTKGKKSFSVIEKNLQDNHGISATIY